MLKHFNPCGHFRRFICATVIATCFHALLAHSTGFNLTVMERKIPKGPRYTLCLITAEANKFSFRLPKEFKVRTDAANKSIILYKLDNSCAVHMKFNEETGSPQNSHESLRARVLASHPGAEIMEEFDTSAARMACPAFELRKASKGYGIASRVIFVPFQNAEVELTLIAPIRRGENMDNCYSLLNDVGSSLWQGTLDSVWNLGSATARIE